MDEWDPETRTAVRHTHPWWRIDVGPDEQGLSWCTTFWSWRLRHTLRWRVYIWYLGKRGY